MTAALGPSGRQILLVLSPHRFIADLMGWVFVRTDPSEPAAPHVATLAFGTGPCVTCASRSGALALELMKNELRHPPGFCPTVIFVPPGFTMVGTGLCRRLGSVGVKCPAVVLCKSLI